MSRRCLNFLLAPLLLLLSPAGAKPLPALQVMTYNLRYASPVPPQAWPERRPRMAEVIRRVGPDVIGTQEGVYSQLRDLEADLPGYRWIGLGREGGSRGEFMAVYYRAERLEPVAFDHFWLSDTPQLIGSATWGNRFQRMVTWVRFRDRAAAREFEVWNTHFDHEVEEARLRSAALLRERLAEVDPNLPVILLGDFNAPAPASAVHQRLVADGFLRDAWAAAAERAGEGLGTFNGFERPDGGPARIDWILWRGALDPERAEIVADRPDQVYPSDHYPVSVRFRWRELAAPPADAP